MICCGELHSLNRVSTKNPAITDGDWRWFSLRLLSLLKESSTTSLLVDSAEAMAPIKASRKSPLNPSTVKTKSSGSIKTDACPNGMLKTTGTYNAAPSMHLDPMASSLLNPASTWISTTMTSLGLIPWHKQNIKSHQALHDEQGFFVVVANKI